MTRRKYIKGPAITDIGEVVRLLMDGQWFYWPTSDRPKSPKILANMPVVVLARAARRGRLRLAVRASEDD